MYGPSPYTSLVQSWSSWCHHRSPRTHRQGQFYRVQLKATLDGEKKVRLCPHQKDLNKNIRREHCYSRTIGELLPLLHGKKYLSIVYTKKGYWHVELDYSSRPLCTFNTPFGRYRFKRLPFGAVVSQNVLPTQTRWSIQRHPKRNRNSWRYPNLQFHWTRTWPGIHQDAPS